MQAQPKIRKATQGDAEAITALIAEAYAPYIPRIGQKPGPMLDDYQQVIAECSVFVLADDDGIQGVLVLSPQGAELLLNNIAILPRHKGKGFGKVLMAYCEEYATTNGYQAIQLYTHQLMTENIAIYTKLGYEETHRATEDGFPRVFMRKPLL